VPRAEPMKFIKQKMHKVIKYKFCFMGLARSTIRARCVQESEVNMALPEYLRKLVTPQVRRTDKLSGLVVPFLSGCQTGWYNLGNHRWQFTINGNYVLGATSECTDKEFTKAVKTYAEPLGFWRQDDVQAG